MTKARSVADTVLGEAAYGTPQQRYQDMLGIASVIANRAALTNTTPEDVVSAPGQFNAYGKTLPPGVSAYRSLAQKAIDAVKIDGPINSATYYATPSAVKNLPGGLAPVGETTGHQYFEDPENRAIRTAVGYRTPGALLGPAAPKSALSAITQAMGLSAPAISAPGLGPMASPYASMKDDATAKNLSSVSYSAPRGLAAVVDTAKNMAGVTYGMGPNRPNKPSQDVVDTVRSAVRDTLGPGYSVNVTSGTEAPGMPQYGSNRHKTGLAVDFEVVDPAGRKLNSFQDKQALVDVAQAAAAKGIKGIGIGTNYMGGLAIHMDKFTPGVGQANQWGNIGKANAALFDNARTFKEMPGSFYSKSLPASMQAPPAKPSASPLTAAPVGKVTRSPLGPVSLAPDRAMPSGPIAMSNVGSLPPDRTMPSGPVKTAPSLVPDRAMPTGPLSLANLAAPSAPKVSVPSSAVTGMLSSALTAAPQSFTPQAAPLTPARPTVAPVPATAVPAPAVAVARVAPPTPSYSKQNVAPARPSLSVGDVYGGTVGTAQTSTPGTTVSRATTYGPTYTTNKFGAVTAVAPDGTQMAAWGGVPTAKPAISGPLSQTGIATPAAPSGMFGPKAKATTGLVTGAAIGGYALGPLGAMLGGLIGKNVAAGKPALSGLLGGSNNANTHMVDTFQGQMKFANAQGGLGFPSAPSNPGGLKANSTNNSAAGMRGISPGAAGAIGRGEGGLY